MAKHTVNFSKFEASTIMSSPLQCFFSMWKNDFLLWKFYQLPPWKNQNVREKISKTTREKPRVPVKISKKSLPWKLDFDTWKKTKIACVKTKKWPWKFLKKSLKVPFFADIFQFCYNFFSYPAIFILLIKNSVRENKTLYMKKFNFLCMKT